MPWALSALVQVEIWRSARPIRMAKSGNTAKSQRAGAAELAHADQWTKLVRMHPVGPGYRTHPGLSTPAVLRLAAPWLSHCRMGLSRVMRGVFYGVGPAQRVAIPINAGQGFLFSPAR
ncbi:hypothetical protein LY76DRAFT_119188 [Colletotrichum caudatum]|nr:hypothetical protein LY76DRAFT_119188 [Colletotrichum caudatum]